MPDRIPTTPTTVPIAPVFRDAEAGTTAMMRGHQGESVKQLQILEVFMRHPGEVLSRYQLLEQAWDYDYENRSNIVDVYVRYLRDKIDRPFGRSSLETVRGAGYRLDDRVPALAA